MILDGEIILIDNDRFEYDFLKEALQRLDYTVDVVYLQNAKEGYEYLKRTKKEIFLIISEIDFNHSGGFALKDALNKDEDTRLKSIPFVFIANFISKPVVDAAYNYQIQGLFVKPAKINELTDLFSTIIKYWIINVHPNKSEAFYMPAGWRAQE